MKPAPADQPTIPARSLAELEQIELSNMTAEALWAELSVALNDLAGRFERFARIVTELEKRGEDVDRFKTGLGIYLPRIACGSVAAEAVVKFAGQPMLLERIAQLPPDRQRELAKGESVLVVEKQGTEFTHRMLPVHCLNADQTRQVFDKDRGLIRSEVEQINILNPPQPAKVVASRPRVKIDQRRKLVFVGDASAPIEDVLDALRKAKLI